MVCCRPILGLFSVSGAYLNTLHILGMERPAYDNFPKNRNGTGYGGQNQEFRDALLRSKLRGVRYRNPSNEWLAKFIQEELFTFDYEETAAWYAETARKLSPSTGDLALLGCNDRYFLLTVLLGRQDAEHPWLFDRYGRLYRPVGALPLQVEHHHLRWRYPGGDVRSRDHGRYLLGHPADRGQVSAPDQGRVRAEQYAEVRLSGCDANPRTLDTDGRPSSWSVDGGITVKRRTNPKESTIEAHGLIDGQPTSRHFRLHVYDDVVTQDHLSDDQIKKTTERWELADNLGSHEGVRKWMPGTRYHFADTYGVVIDRKSLKPRIYPATEDGTLTGKPVFLSNERWDQLKNDQRSTVSAQLLLNPIAGDEATFSSLWLRPYEVIPAVLNVYIMVDPSLGNTQRSDRTAISVIGVDQ